MLEPHEKLVVEGVGRIPDAGRDADFGEGKMTAPFTDSACSGISNADGRSPATDLRRPSRTEFGVILERSSSDSDQVLRMALSLPFPANPESFA